MYMYCFRKPNMRYQRYRFVPNQSTVIPLSIPMYTQSELNGIFGILS